LQPTSYCRGCAGGMETFITSSSVGAVGNSEITRFTTIQ
jgi:hypothetical protein